jgi:hypothetical protein
MAEDLIQRVMRGAAKSKTLRRPQDALFCNMELPLRGTFFPLGYPVEILTNDYGVLRAAHESFGHAQFSRTATTLQMRFGVSHEGGDDCPAEPTRREFGHLYSLVADVNNQSLLDLRTCTSFTWLTRATVRNRLYFRLNFLEKVVYLLLGASVVTDLHAACVSKNGKGILIFGDSGAGKSTLAYGCARAGWTYTSDDTSYLLNGSNPPRVIGHAHRARFRPTAKSLFPELECRELTPRLEGKPSIEVPTSDLPIRSTSAEAAVDSIVYLARNSSACARLTPLPRGTATERACQELYSAGEIREKHEKILGCLSEIPTYELEYSDLNDAIQALGLLTRSRESNGISLSDSSQSLV